MFYITFSYSLKNILCFFILLFLISFLDYTDGQREKKFFRKDYVFLEKTQSFYKIHTIHKIWRDAKNTCDLEGASLLYPEDKNEADAVLDYWKEAQPFKWMWSGITDLVAKGVFETIDGRPIIDVYHNWGATQPDDTGGMEDCVTFRRDGTLNDDLCDYKYPFICKKSLNSLEWNEECNMPSIGYTLNPTLGRCYKFHTKPKTWVDAYVTCAAEQSYLAIINNVEEAYYLVNLTGEALKFKAKNSSTKEAVHLGFHNRIGDDWSTVKGTSLEDSGYVMWANGQPDGGENEKCGAMSYDGELHDLPCTAKRFFVCEHDVNIFSNSFDERYGKKI